MSDVGTELPRSYGTGPDALEDISSVRGGSYVLTRYDAEKDKTYGLLVRKFVLVNSERDEILDINIPLIDEVFILNSIVRNIVKDCSLIASASNFCWIGDDSEKDYIVSLLEETRTLCGSALHKLEGVAFVPDDEERGSEEGSDVSRS